MDTSVRMRANKQNMIVQLFLFWFCPGESSLHPYSSRVHLRYRGELGALGELGGTRGEIQPTTEGVGPRLSHAVGPE